MAIDPISLSAIISGASSTFLGMAGLQQKKRALELERQTRDAETRRNRESLAMQRAVLASDLMKRDLATQRSNMYSDQRRSHIWRG